jgi:PPOX class probable F420-dependent enzyme
MTPNELARERYVNLITFKRSGDGVETPIWFAADPQDPRRLWMYTNGRSWKVKRIRNDARARVAACNARGKLHGPWLDAKARIENDERAIGRAFDLLVAKYGWQARLLLIGARLGNTWKDRTVLEVTLA